MDYRKTHPKESMLVRARAGAKKIGKPFLITLKDIPDIPERCPVFPWIRLVYRVGHSYKGSGTANKSKDVPSLDRINNDLGYVPGNLRIISWAANAAKSDLNDEELMALGEDARKRNLNKSAIK